MSEPLHSSKAGAPPRWLRAVPQTVESPRYGVVPLVVHDGRVAHHAREGRPDTLT